MGKVKNKRSLHTKAVKVTKEEGSNNPATAAPSAGAPKDGGIFSQLEIDFNALSKQLGDNSADDSRSAITSKSMQGMGLKKKDKQKLRREFFMKKIDTIQAAKKEAKERKKRQNTAVVGDMQALGDTLPTLDLLLRDLSKPQDAIRKSNKEGSSKTKSIKKQGTRKKEQNNDLSVFQQVLQHPQFKADPLATISEHLQNRMAQEDDMNT